MYLTNVLNFSTKINNRSPLVLYKHLLRQCEKLPKGAKQHYVFSIKQSYKQYRNETDPQRIEDIITRAYEDCHISAQNKIMLVPLATSGCIVPVDRFWKAVMVYHDRPNVINKKIVGVSQAYLYQINTSIKTINGLFSYTSMIYEIRKLPEISKQHLTDFVKNILVPYDKNLILHESSNDAFKRASENIFISVRILLPKQNVQKKCVEVVVLDKDRNTATFHAVGEKDRHSLAPPFSYAIELTTSGYVRIAINNLEDAETNSAVWLIEKLFYKLLKWVDEEDICGSIQSLSLISIEKYTDLYQNLKIKYGRKMIDIWPENTDPLKFVYEDVAIAAYLITLWKKTNQKKKPTFVDVGCGNGLLVYILNQEGFEGCGIDVHKRKIWDLYPENTKLQIRTLIPSSLSLFPESDWIIGNHSDELTPWIPVIAARSSLTTNFFVLPCCCYDFSGHKYVRINTSKSQYAEYLDYIMDVSKKCGFVAENDKLRIPSTKKTCIVSLGRTYEANNYDKVDKDLTDFINSRCDNKSSEESTNWVNNFEPRREVEKVRNCTKLDKNIREIIILKVVNKLLGIEKFVQTQSGQSWNAGGVLTFKELAECVDAQERKRLKNECGGLQTLLKNHRYIFEVCKDTAKIRVPMTYGEVTKYKNKPCWFFINHPDGCLHDEDSCAYSHK